MVADTRPLPRNPSTYGRFGATANRLQSRPRSTRVPWTSQPRIHLPPPWFRARQDQVRSWRRALRQLGLHTSREHFVTHTRGRLGGRAKSMVVTASRQSAVQMARAIKSYIADREYDTKYPDIGVLVAFCGSLTYEGEETTEAKENGGIPESAPPKAFAYTRADDRSTWSGGNGQQEYRIRSSLRSTDTDGWNPAAARPLDSSDQPAYKITGISKQRR